jgi:hypothetical protein
VRSMRRRPRASHRLPITRWGLYVFFSLAGVLGPCREARADETAAAVPSTASREDNPDVTFGASGGAEVGGGVVSPSVGVAFGHLLGRLGVAMHTSPHLSVIAGGETGLGAAFGSGSPAYGYVLRLPLKFYSDVIFSNLLNYRQRSYANLHLGGNFGPEYFLSAECAAGTCNYIPAGAQWGFGARVGISFSQGTRSSVGVFARWDGDVANGSCSGTAQCLNLIQTFTWNLGWTTF